MHVLVGIYSQSLPQNGANKNIVHCTAAIATPKIELSRLLSTIIVGVIGCAMPAEIQKSVSTQKNAKCVFVFLIAVSLSRKNGTLQKARSFFNQARYG